MARSMPETIALADGNVAHLNGEENLQRRLPGLVIYLGVDTEGPGGLSPVLDDVHSRADDIGEIEDGVPVVQKLSPRFRRTGLDKLPLAGEGQLEQVYASSSVIAWIELQHCPLGLPGMVSHLRDANDGRAPPLRIDGRPDLKFHLGVARPRLDGGGHRKPASRMIAALIVELEHAAVPLERNTVGWILLGQSQRPGGLQQGPLPPELPGKHACHRVALKCFHEVRGRVQGHEESHSPNLAPIQWPLEFQVDEHALAVRAAYQLVTQVQPGHLANDRSRFPLPVYHTAHHAGG